MPGNRPDTEEVKRCLGGYASSVRSVFVFPNSKQAEIVARLDRVLPQQQNPWSDGNVYVWIVGDLDGLLFDHWEPHEVAGLERAFGRRPDWAVEVAVSGRIDGTEEVYRLTSELLQGGGVAIDDYTDEHPWTLAEIERGDRANGLRYFDFRTHNERIRGTRE